MAFAGAAQAALQALMEEEEEMTNYTHDDLNNYEFKILRSAISGFRSPETLAKALEEESVHGWQLVEKFDDARIRLKRPRGAKSRVNTGAGAGTDPYRTQYGISDGRFAIYIVTGTLLLCAVIIGGLVYFIN